MLLSLAVAGLAARLATAQSGNGAPERTGGATTVTTQTTTAAAGQLTAPTSLQLAKKYTATEFLDWEYFTDDDPTQGYVNYVSLKEGESKGLVQTDANGAFVMRADSTNMGAGRGRDSIRIVSKEEFGDGVYILDLNHMPVGCGSWPAFWTVVNKGWPGGGEIDIIEGANAYPSQYSTAWNVTNAIGFRNASAGYPPTSDVVSLHTESDCGIPRNTFMTGQVGSDTCSAYKNGNTGCGVDLGAKGVYGADSFGAGVNEIGGGWYALWRDVQNSGGVYAYYWPRNAPNVPDDVRNPDTTATNVAGWGQPGANLSIPNCKGDFDKHVIVFNIAFCGGYAGGTYLASGCPTGYCQGFVAGNPKAFEETYWSINNLRVYTANGQIAGMVGSGSPLSAGAIAGIAVGGVVVLAIIGFLLWRHRRKTVTRRRLDDVARGGRYADENALVQKRSSWVGGGSNESVGDAVPSFAFATGTSARGSLSNGSGEPATTINRAAGGARRDSAAKAKKEHKEKKAKKEKAPTAIKTLPFNFGAPKLLLDDANAQSAPQPAAPAPLVPGFIRAADLAAEDDLDAQMEAEESAKKQKKQYKATTVGYAQADGTILATPKPRMGKTVLAPGKTPKHYLAGETPSGVYREPVTLADEVPPSGTGSPSSSRRPSAAWVG